MSRPVFHFSSVFLLLGIAVAACASVPYDCPSVHVDDDRDTRGAEGSSDDPAYARRLCYVDGVSLRYHALDLPSRRGLTLRVLPNPTVRREIACAGGIAGEALDQLPIGADDFEPLAATNGNFFHFTATGTRSNGFLWSRGGSPAGTVIAPLQDTHDQDMRGDRVVVADPDGLHALVIETDPCEPGTCRARVSGHPLLADHFFGDAALAAGILRAFPRATFAMQVVPALAETPPATPDAALAPAWRCPADRNSQDAWKCERQPATLLCGHPDGTISLYAVEPARYAEMVWGLREGGPCQTRCDALYILDGGHSTQMWTRDPLRREWRPRFVRYRQESAVGPCARHRPVDHYLVVGRRRIVEEPTQ